MAPVGAKNPRLLLLGSLPGDASLAAQRYYAHPTNQFWRLLGAALDEPLGELPYEERLARIDHRGVALWDVVDRAERPGSLDGAIRAAVHNPLADFVAGLPRLAAVAFNGKTAGRIGRSRLGGVASSGPALVLIDLPSSSAAFTLPFTAKAGAWRALAGFADSS